MLEPVSLVIWFAILGFGALDVGVGALDFLGALGGVGVLDV